MAYLLQCAKFEYYELNSLQNSRIYFFASVRNFPSHQTKCLERAETKEKG